MISAFRTEHDGRVYWAAIAILITSAWLSLILLGTSPYAGYLSHHHAGYLSHHHLSEGGLSFGRLLAIFVPSWTLMTVAMMLPTSLPLVTLFRTMVRRKPHATTLVSLLIVAYLGTWALFGGGVYLLDRVFHEVIEHTPLLAANTAYLAVGILLLAGIYQFTPLKDRCLEKCRSPLSFVAEHWHGGSGRLDALRLGFKHGLFCLGCCWTLMLVMFAVGGANLGWMLGLGAVMAAEKSAPWGRRLVAPVGVALIVWAVALILKMVAAPFGS